MSSKLKVPCYTNNVVKSLLLLTIYGTPFTASLDTVSQIIAIMAKFVTRNEMKKYDGSNATKLHK